MAVAKSELSVVDRLRARTGRNPRTRARDVVYLRVVEELREPDFDAVATRIGHDAALRDGLAAWLVSARYRGLIEPRATVGARQRFGVTPLGRERLIVGD